MKKLVPFGAGPTRVRGNIGGDHLGLENNRHAHGPASTDSDCSLHASVKLNGGLGAAAFTRRPPVESTKRTLQRERGENFSINRHSASKIAGSGCSRAVISRM